MFGIDPERTGLPEGSHLLFQRSAGGYFFKVKGLVQGGRLRQLDVWRHRDAGYSDKKRIKLFLEGDKDQRKKLKPGSRSYDHFVYRYGVKEPKDIWKDGRPHGELGSFGGLRGGRVHGVEANQLSMREVDRALKGKRRPGKWRR